MFLTSTLEQFLLLQDKISGVITIILGVPIAEDYKHFLQFWYIGDIYDFFRYDVILGNYPSFFFMITLVNIQYYKLSLFLIAMVTLLSTIKSEVYPNSLWQFLTQKSHVLAQTILKPTFGDHYPFTVRFYNYYPFLYHIFLFILFNNLLGLVPYGFSNSAFIIHNFVLSFFCLVGLTLIGIFIQGIYYYKLFIPKNVPAMLIPFLMIIELISHVAKAFSLAIRLFANIMSSHILLHILAGFTLKILDFNLILGLIPCILILAIVFLEIGIAFLQAYVFTILLAIYFEETFVLLKNQPNLKFFETNIVYTDFDYQKYELSQNSCV